MFLPIETRSTQKHDTAPTVLCTLLQSYIRHTVKRGNSQFPIHPLHLSPLSFSFHIILLTTVHYNTHVETYTDKIKQEYTQLIVTSVVSDSMMMILDAPFYKFFFLSYFVSHTHIILSALFSTLIILSLQINTPSQYIPISLNMKCESK
jgi:hypothetical protein